MQTCFKSVTDVGYLRFERQQYLEMRELWASGKEEWADKGAGDTYGAEHLSRLLGTSTFQNFSRGDSTDYHQFLYQS